MGDSVGEGAGALEFAFFFGVEEEAVAWGDDGDSAAYFFDSVFVSVGGGG